MTPGTRLLNALYAWVNAPDRFARDGLEQEVIDAYDAVPADARALYPAAHAMGERVSVAARPDEDVLPELRLPFMGDVTAVTFHEAGVRYEVRHPRAGYVDVDSAFVHPAPTSPIGVPVIESHHVTGGLLLNTAAPEVQEVGAVPAQTVADILPGFLLHEVKDGFAEYRGGGSTVGAPEPVGQIAFSGAPDIPKRTGVPKNEYVCLLLGGNPLTRCVLASGHEGACVAEKDRWVPGEPFDYDSLTDDEKASLRKTPLYTRTKELGLVPITRTNTLLIPNRVQITRHTDEHGVKTTETVDLRDPDDLHARFAEALGAEWKTLTGDVRHEWLAAFERAVEIAGEVWVKPEIRTSRRNLPLVYQGPPPTITTLTVESYGKWYELQALHPDGRVEPVSYGTLEGFCDEEEMTPYVDHVPNPVLVERLCNAMGWELDEQAHEMMIGRWLREGMDVTVEQVNALVRGRH